MKKLLQIISGILCLAALCGCASSGYRCYKKDGQHRVNIGLKNTSANNDNSFSQASLILDFQSLDEMRQDIKNGSFTEDEMATLASAQQRYGVIDVGFDLDNLYEIIPPESKLKMVSWGLDSKCYTFSYDCTTFSFVAALKSKEFFDNVLAQEFQFKPLENASDAVKYHGEKIYVKNNTVTTDIYYMATTENATVYVWEMYSNKLKYSMHIKFLVETNGMYYSGSLYSEDGKLPESAGDWLAKCEVKKHESN